MKYELARELKEVGFPMSRNRMWRLTYFNNEHKLVGAGQGNNLIREEEFDFIPPTLEELIEACGDYVVLHNLSEGWMAGIGDKHSCGGGYIDSGLESESEGKTPTEAVARLWLSLNKKHE